MCCILTSPIATDTFPIGRCVEAYVFDAVKIRNDVTSKKIFLKFMARSFLSEVSEKNPVAVILIMRNRNVII